jgi:outer membrane lipoprotein-sorting protein
MKNPILLILLSFIIIINVNAQTVDEILEEHFAVIGQDKMLQMNTFSTKGKIIQGQVEIPFTSYHKRPMYFRSEASFQGMEIISVFDGESGWSINPFAGATDPQPMTAEQLDRMELQADFDGMFYNYSEKGYKVELMETEEVDDIETYVLKLTRPNGDIITTYIDSENYVILKAKSKMIVQDVETEMENIFSNYKYNNEILSAHSIETQREGQTIMQMIFEEITYDVEIPDSLFAMPEPTAPIDSTVTPDSTVSEEKPE